MTLIFVGEEIDKLSHKAKIQRLHFFAEKHVEMEAKDCFVLMTSSGIVW